MEELQILVMMGSRVCMTMRMNDCDRVEDKLIGERGQSIISIIPMDIAVTKN